jgi:hypothetical protein
MAVLAENEEVETIPTTNNKEGHLCYTGSDSEYLILVSLG